MLPSRRLLIHFSGIESCLEVAPLMPVCTPLDDLRAVVKVRAKSTAGWTSKLVRRLSALDIGLTPLSLAAVVTHPTVTKASSCENRAETRSYIHTRRIS